MTMGVSLVHLFGLIILVIGELTGIGVLLWIVLPLLEDWRNPKPTIPYSSRQRLRN
jgi:hypothetical protein